MVSISELILITPHKLSEGLKDPANLGTIAAPSTCPHMRTSQSRSSLPGPPRNAQHVSCTPKLFVVPSRWSKSVRTCGQLGRLGRPVTPRAELERSIPAIHIPLPLPSHYSTMSARADIFEAPHHISCWAVYWLGCREDCLEDSAISHLMFMSTNMRPCLLG
jgi:hypothetical protein